MMWSCDVISAWEDGGIGGIVVAIVAALLAWWKHKSSQQPSR